MPHLKHLLFLNKGLGHFRLDASNADEPTIYLYDMIVSEDWWGGVTPLAFATQLASLTAPVIHLRINSPGGDVFAARAMVQAMQEHPSKIIAHIDGVCASAATYPALAADECIIADGAMFMIHNAWTVAGGESKDFIAMGNLLGRIDAILANDYAKKSGQTIEQITEWMNAETYWFGQEAVDAGFCTGLAEGAISNKIKWDLSAYKQAPKNIGPSLDSDNDGNAETSEDPDMDGDDDEDEEGDTDNDKDKNLIPDDATIYDYSHLYRRLELVEKTAA